MLYLKSENSFCKKNVHCIYFTIFMLAFIYKICYNKGSNFYLAFQCYMTKGVYKRLDLLMVLIHSKKSKKKSHQKVVINTILLLLEKIKKNLQPLKGEIIEYFKDLLARKSFITTTTKQLDTSIKTVMFRYGCFFFFVSLKIIFF